MIICFENSAEVVAFSATEGFVKFRSEIVRVEFEPAEVILIVSEELVRALRSRVKLPLLRIFLTERELKPEFFIFNV